LLYHDEDLKNKSTRVLTVGGGTRFRLGAWVVAIEGRRTEKGKCQRMPVRSKLASNAGYIVGICVE